MEGHRMRILSIVTIVLLSGFALGGEAPPAVFGAVEMQGYIVLDDVDSVSYTRWFFPAREGGMSSITLSQAGRGGKTVISLSPESAQKMAEEAEPYRMLASRGRKFSEKIEIDDSVAMTIAYDRQLRLRVTGANGATLQYAGEKADAVLAGLLRARHVADEWVEGFFEGDRKGWRRPPPFRTPPAPPVEPGRPQRGSEREPIGRGGRDPRPGGDTSMFVLDDVRIQPMGLGDFLEVKGVLVNQGGGNYKNAIFTVSFFDRRKKFLGSVQFSVDNFNRGSRTVFEALSQDRIMEWDSYSIQLNTSIN